MSSPRRSKRHQPPAGRASFGPGTARRFPRTARINEALREVLADSLERLADHDDRLGLITVTAVQSDPDMAKAVVYLDHLDGQRAEALAEARVRLQAAVAAEVRLKRTPLLSFEPDPAVSTGERVEEILRRINRAPGQEESDGDI